MDRGESGHEAMPNSLCLRGCQAKATKRMGEEQGGANGKGLKQDPRTAWATKEANGRGSRILRGTFEEKTSLSQP